MPGSDPQLSADGGRRSRGLSKVRGRCPDALGGEERLEDFVESLGGDS